ncbi:MAG TPA: hypothetical protein VLF91_00685 [Candidatus Saccharimonadales bacterium]|nr:hypothetical protein [Candidatus Saccharimonadales bacterium]
MKLLYKIKRRLQWSMTTIAAAAALTAGLTATPILSGTALASGCNHNQVDAVDWGPGFWQHVNGQGDFWVHASGLLFTGDSSSTCNDINATNVTEGTCTGNRVFFVQMYNPPGHNYFGPVGPTLVPLQSSSLTVLNAGVGNGVGYRVLFSDSHVELGQCLYPTVPLLD